MNPTPQIVDPVSHSDANVGERSRLLTLVFTDLVNSVGLKTRLGDTDAGRIIAAHHEGLRELCGLSGGREILAAGDGSFLTFETPSRAVEFALRLQNFHRENPKLPEVRIGIHMGEVTEKQNTPDSNRPIDIEGLAVDIASRIQSLARPHQILLSYPVFDNARQRLDTSFLQFPVEWRAHGRYVFQGSDMALEIYEVGQKGIAAFAPPSGSTKAQRDVDGEDESTLGWRPAQGLELPGRPNYVLTEKLGEGGFGDVWLAEHRKTRDRHVIKFCYSTDRLRALKREVTLFRLLKETLGDRPDIARVLDYQFDAPPYFLEMEFAGRYNLTTWLQKKGGVAAIPMDTRIELVAQVADAIAAAHSVGILHKDVKPTNIMVTESGTAKPRIRMIDFGIGTVADRHLLDIKGITATGLTEAESRGDYASSMTGTRLYMAPELIEGKAATTKSDIYSLGVLLYQMVSGKLGQTLSFGWERDVPDELLRQDIEACVDGRPENRLGSAEELALRLRKLPARRAAKEEHQHELRRIETSKKRRHLFYIGAGVLCLLMVFVGFFALMQHQKATAQEQLRMRAEAARKEADKQAIVARQAQLEAISQTQKTQNALAEVQQARYFGAIALAEASLREHRFEKAQEVLLNETPEEYRQREWGWLLAQTAPENFALKKFEIFDAKFSPDGETFIAGSRDGAGRGHVAVYNARSGKRLSDLLTNNRLVWNLSLSPDGRLAATASSDNVVSVVDLEANSIVSRLTQHTGIIRDVAFSPDGKLLATCSRDDSILLWNTSDFTVTQDIKVPGDSFTEIAFSPDSRYVAVGSLETHGRVFDVSTGAQAAMLTGHEDRVLSVDFLANNQGVVTGCKDGMTRLYAWPPEVGVPVLQPTLSIRSINSYPAQVLTSHDGNYVFVGADDGSISKIDVKTGLQVLDLQVDQPLWKLSLSGDGKRLLTTTRWSVRLLDVERLAGECEIDDIDNPLVAPGDAEALDVSTVVSLRDQTWTADEVWRTTSGLSLVKVNDHKFLVKSAYDVYSRDGLQHLKINPNNLSASVISTTSGMRLKGFGKQIITGAAYSPDGRQAAVLLEQNGIGVFETASWKRLYSIETGGFSPTSVLYTKDSSKLIAGYVTGAINVHQTTDGSLLKSIREGRAGGVLSMDLSSDEKLLAAGFEVDRAEVYNMESGDQVSTMTGHVRYVHGVKFAPTNERLATLSRDGTIKLWDVATGRELVTMFSLTEGAVPVGLYFAKGGRFAAAVTSDHKVVITDIFPWNATVYGQGTAPIASRVELWKRRYRVGNNVSMSDVLPEEVVGPPGLEPGTSRL